jgi:selenocysteine lyase/cysteine desulfurase
MSSAAPIPSQRHLFDLPPDIAYLNCAYMSPLLKRSAELGREALARKLRPWTITPDDFFGDSERARALFAALIGATADDVAIVPSASYGLAIAALNLSVARRARILVLADQFPSNVYVWRALTGRSGGEVATVATPEDGDLTGAVLRLLDEQVAIAALPHCRWTDGALLDLAAIGARCREIGAALVLDVTQSLGALPLDAGVVQPDFLVCAGYKWLLGPYSLGYLYVAPRRQDGRPLEENWIGRAGSEDFARLIDYQERYQPGAKRFDVGERSNFALLPASIAALEQLLAWGVEAIAGTLAGKTQAIAERAATLGLSSMPLRLRAGHFLGLSFANAMPAGLPERLAEEHVHVSLRGASLRVTPHLYNEESDVDRLFAVLKSVI